MLCLETNMRQCCLWAFVCALIVFGAAATRANDGCTQCEGCPYHVDGQCITNPVQFGYYRTNWRRWPGDFPLAEPEIPQVPATVPDTTVPEPRYEDESMTRPHRKPNASSISPGTPIDDQEDVPALPGELQKNDWQKDPFQDDPVPEIPDIQDDLLDDLSQPQTSTTGDRRNLTNRQDRRRWGHRRGQQPQRRNATSGPVKLASPLGPPSAVMPASAATALPENGVMGRGNKNPLRSIQKLTAQASVPNKRHRENPLR